jgi:hypothetical protein
VLTRPAWQRRRALTHLGAPEAHAARDRLAQRLAPRAAFSSDTYRFACVFPAPARCQHGDHVCRASIFGGVSPPAYIYACLSRTPLRPEARPRSLGACLASKTSERVRAAVLYLCCRLETLSDMLRLHQGLDAVVPAAETTARARGYKPMTACTLLLTGSEDLA